MVLQKSVNGHQPLFRDFAIIFAFCASSAELLLSQHAYAGGFYLSEIGTPGSLGTAGVANPTNTIAADSAFTNPAGMTGLDQDEVLGGFQLIIPNIQFESSIAEAGERFL